MNHQLLQYIAFARERKLNDKDIRDNLVGAGWDAGQVDDALKAGKDAMLMPPPPPGQGHGGMATGQAGQPIAVIQQRTTRGLEYIIMFIALGVTAIALGALLHSLVDNVFGFTSDLTELTSYAVPALLVAMPIFAILFLRLKKAELAEPNIRTDPSRRHAIQLLLIVAFAWGLGRLIVYIYSLMNGGGDSYLGSNIAAPLGNFLHTLVTVGIAGSIFAYYWADEHREKQ